MSGPDRAQHQADQAETEVPATDQAIRADATPTRQRQLLAPPAARHQASDETRKAGQWS